MTRKRTGVGWKGVVAGVGLLAVLLWVGSRGDGAGGEGSPADGYMAEYGGNPAVYERIAADTSCDSLQAEFDQAAANHDRDSDAGDLTAMKWSTGYMSAADDRMRALGCYE